MPLLVHYAGCTVCHPPEGKLSEEVCLSRKALTPRTPCLVCLWMLLRVLPIMGAADHNAVVP